MAEAVAEEYRSSLCDLNFNSKPHINMLTIIAEENAKYAAVISEAIVDHINAVPSDLKLPGLYLVDSIIKNVGGQYITLFCKHVITLFASVFEKVEEATRSALFKLRQTWNDILPKNVLYGIDCSVNKIDPAWPITAQVPTPSPTIHVNPKFVGPPASKVATVPTTTLQMGATRKPEVFSMNKNEEMRQKHEETLRMIEEKKRQLEELQRRKLEMAARLPFKVAKQIGGGLLNQPHVVQHPIPDRDPRLKKTQPPPIDNTPSRIPDKPPNSSLQSVVVVPPPKAPEREVTPPARKDTKAVSEQNNSSGAKVSDPRKRNDKEKSNESSGGSKKRSLSSPKKEESPHKKAKSKGSRKDRRSSGESTRSSPKKIAKDQPPPTSSINESSLLFGSRDLDYRQYSIPQNNVSSNPSRKPPDAVAQPPPAPAPQSTFYPQELIPTAKTVSDSNGTFVPEQILRRPEAIKTEKPDFVPTEHPIVHKMTEIIPPSVFIKQEENPFPPNQMPIPNDRLLHRNTGSPLDTKMFMLDGKNRSIHFNNEKAYAIMDDNTPREISFFGPPRNVYIEGLPQPLVIGFDNRTHEFTTDGKVNTIRFGAPSREIYINNFPYEAVFGGPTFTALLEDKKDHRIRIDGPPPQVLVSQPAPSAPVEEKMVDQSEMRDVDMRLKPTSFIQPPAPIPMPEKDIDWRQVPGEAPWANRPYPKPEPQNVSVPTSLIGPSGDWIRAPMPLQPPPSIPAALLQPTPVTTVPQPLPQWVPLPPPPMFDPSLMSRPPVGEVSVASSYIKPPTPPLPMRESSNPLPPEIPSRIPSTPLTFEALKGILAGINNSSSVKPEPAVVNNPPPPVVASHPVRIKEERKKEERKKKGRKEREEVAVDLTKFDTKLFKVYHEGSTHSLHVGSQCAECGMRFVAADKYSRHLDWHFRMNRREKERIKRAYYRPWFHKLEEWNKFIEFEQAEERKPSFFELQGENKASPAEEEKEVPSVASANESESEKCAVCSEMFRLKWKGDLEEWHLFPAIKMEGELYHPLCYDDHVKALELEKRAVEEAARKAEEEAKKAEEEAKKAAEEAAIKAEEDAKKAAEEEAIKAEEDAKKAEEEAKKAEEDAKKAEEDAKKAEEEEENKMDQSETAIKEEPEEEKMEVEDGAKAEEAETAKEVKVKDEPPHSPQDKQAEQAPSSPEEFRPPTPDPRFQVLEPVHRGNELSALCSIM